MGKRKSWKPCRGTIVFEKSFEKAHKLWFEIQMCDELFEKSKLIFSHYKHERIMWGDNSPLVKSPLFFLDETEIEEIRNGVRIYKKLRELLDLNYQNDMQNPYCLTRTQ